MARQLQKFDAIDVTEVYRDNMFVESDYGNYVAIKKKIGQWELESYDGSLREYLDENEIKKGRSMGGTVVGDYFGQNVIIKQASKVE